MTLTEELRERLNDLGYEVSENEEDVLKRALERAERNIINTLNCEGVPEELKFVLLDMAAGEYLLAARSTDSGADVKSVSEGDVSVTFDSDECDEELIDRLLSNGRNEMLSYRRVKW